ncbi:sugar phosphate nucleotidyltransferase [Pararhodobacter sp. CCB-MM2]|uniref:sugar phosphate nucleotidyltransferase n=1 Tax=Pararhodobacter sp. CCB-MM2 TaxID=1786003 RepID=UPI00082D9740|nr:sugar phosphate nucleotidyltransferase [Pararhodobacter sp. CCB-MM2]
MRDLPDYPRSVVAPLSLPGRSARVTRCLPVLLAGGRGSRLHELTDRQCKPALPFLGGEGRIIDFIMAAVTRAGFERMVLATQYRPLELAIHLRRHWSRQFTRGLTVADGGTLRADGYRGTADCLRANAPMIQTIAPKEIMVLSGDHVLDIDLAAFLEAHRRSGLPVSVAATPVPMAEAKGFGIFSLDAKGQVTGFAEKPAHPEAMPGDADRALASMGIYIFDRDWITTVLARDSGDDFGHDILPIALTEGALGVWQLPDAGPGRAGYWRDVGTLDSYRLTQLDFLGATHPPVPLPLPMAARLPEGEALLAQGSILLPGASAGRDCQLRNAIVAPGVRLPDGFRAGFDPHEDSRWFRRNSAGTLLITPGMMTRYHQLRRAPMAMPRRPGRPNLTAVATL